MEDIFIKGNQITTNDRNCLEVIDSNEHDVVFKDLLNGDFCILSKTEHNYKLADIKVILSLVLKEIVDETDVSPRDKDHILAQMNCRINKWL